MSYLYATLGTWRASRSAGRGCASGGSGSGAVGGGGCDSGGGATAADGAGVTSSRHDRAVATAVLRRPCLPLRACRLRLGSAARCRRHRPFEFECTDLAVELSSVAASEGVKRNAKIGLKQARDSRQRATCAARRHCWRLFLGGGLGGSASGGGGRSAASASARRTFSNWATRLHSLGHQRLAWMSKGGGIGDLGPAPGRCGGWAWRAGWTEWAGWLGGAHAGLAGLDLAQQV
eukprot:scaffold15083_cov66-Phaeocystis_antarctica.AAC.3